MAHGAAVAADWASPGTGATERFEVVVVGGGQAGLAVGYHLARRGLRFVILDAGERTGNSWRKRWDLLRVFTPARLDGLPGMPFPAPAASFPTKDAVADYLEAYAARFALPVRTGVTVDGLARVGDRFVATAGGRRFEADNVVLALGAYQRPRVPAFAPALDPAIVQLHSSEYRRPSQLREGGALVVGAGNSGAEIALEASRGHRTWLSGRDTGHEPVRAGSGPFRVVVPLIWFVATHVLTVQTPLGRRVRRTFRARGLPLARLRRRPHRRRDRAGAADGGGRDGAPVLEDGRALEVANVIWCTGFVPDLAWIDLPLSGEDGPRHERGVVGAEPGLYVLGLYFLYALTSQLLGGVGRDAAHIAAHIAARPNRPARAPAPAGA